MKLKLYVFPLKSIIFILLLLHARYEAYIICRKKNSFFGKKNYFLFQRIVLNSGLVHDEYHPTHEDSFCFKVMHMCQSDKNVTYLQALYES